jgi:sulfite reductase (NADPH) flavoprotein alpha-component
MTVDVPNINSQTTLYLALREHLDIRVLTKKFWENFVYLVADKDDEAHIKDFIINNWKDYNVPSKTYSLLKTLQKFKRLKTTNPNDVILNLKKLSPRLYSIASSPLACPNEVHIVITQ